MKNYILTSILLIGLALSVNAQSNNSVTNTIPPVSLSLSNAPASGKTSGGWELTLGGGGESIHGQNTFGLDFSISTNPFRKRPEVWVGVAQGLYWEPIFTGSTDVFVDWSLPILPSKLNDRLYLNLGWSGGALYDNQEDSSVVWRTGPEATLQYYTSDNAFIFIGTNYDIYKSDETEGGFRFGLGIGLSF